MVRRIRSRVTYANAMATVAVFVALGGSSYALTAGNGSSTHKVTKLEAGEEKVLVDKGPFTVTARCTVTDGNVRTEVIAETSKPGSVWHAEETGGGTLPVGTEVQLVNTEDSTGAASVLGKTFILAGPRAKAVTGYIGVGVNSLDAPCFAFSTGLGD